MLYLGEVAVFFFFICAPESSEFSDFRFEAAAVVAMGSGSGATDPSSEIDFFVESPDDRLGRPRLFGVGLVVGGAGETDWKVKKV